MTIIIDVDEGLLQAFTVCLGVGKRINNVHRDRSVIT